MQGNDGRASNRPDGALSSPNDSGTGQLSLSPQTIGGQPGNSLGLGLNLGTPTHERAGHGLVKMLVPAYAAGSIIGKQGQTISQLQKETGIGIKLSKPKDFYPGTLERIALIQGKVDNNSVNEVVNFIINKVIDFPIPKELIMTNSDRPKQVKIIVPNSTAGLIIGKKGATIKNIMESSNAKVQMTQKPDSLHMQPLLERVITVCGEREQLITAVDMILEKIKDDPQSASCPNLSYQNVTGLIANASPVGSPYAPVNKNQLLSLANSHAQAHAAHANAHNIAHAHATINGIPIHNVNITGTTATNLVQSAATAQTAHAQGQHACLTPSHSQANVAGTAAISAHHPTLNLISGGSLPLNSAIQNLNLSASLAGQNSQIYTVFQ